MKIIEIILKVAPDTPVPYGFILSLFGYENDLVEDLRATIEEQRNPHLQKAEAEAKLLAE
jgi:hypothetical protein